MSRSIRKPEDLPIRRFAFGSFEERRRCVLALPRASSSARHRGDSHPPSRRLAFACAVRSVRIAERAAGFGRACALRDATAPFAVAGCRITIRTAHRQRGLVMSNRKRLRSGAARLHADRTFGGDRHHRRAHLAVAAGRAGGTRGGATHSMSQQPQADRAGGPQLSRRQQPIPAGVNSALQRRHILRLTPLRVHLRRADRLHAGLLLRHVLFTLGRPGPLAATTTTCTHGRNGCCRSWKPTRFTTEFV